VTVLIVPATGRDQRTARRPIVASTRQPLSSRAPLPYALEVQEGQRVRPQQRGNPGCSPSATRRKNACYASSSRASTSCSTWRWRAAYAGNAARIAYSSASCWKRVTETRLRRQAVLRYSSAVWESTRQRHSTASRARSCVGVGRSCAWEVVRLWVSGMGASSNPAPRKPVGGQDSWPTLPTPHHLGCNPAACGGLTPFHVNR
jgi:hypothetical protein